jgi:plastocyanin
MYEGDDFTHTFETVGEYAYFCIPHERAGMVGTVVVTENPDTAASGE